MSTVSAIIIPLFSSSKLPLVPARGAYCHGEVDLLTFGNRKSSRLKHYNISFRRRNSLQSWQRNCLGGEIANKYDAKFHQQSRKFNIFANACSDDSGAVHPNLNAKCLGATLDIIYRYSKAYTLIGTVLSIISVSLLAVENLSNFTISLFFGIFQAILGGCLVNSYVAGLNQISDIEIDKVNKPHQPLVSGELSVKTGILLTLLYGILGICLGWTVKSWPLKLGLLLWLAFGTVYSLNLPLLRWKRDPVLSAVCVWSVQGVIIPILFHLHAQTYIRGRTLLLSKHAIFVSAIMSIYAIVFSLFKDIPDVEGDKMYGINSFASQFGKERVFWICIVLLEMANYFAILIGLSSNRFGIRLIMVIAHCIIGFILWRKANLVDLKSDKAIELFYLFIWKLYSVEYMLVPILRF